MNAHPGISDRMGGADVNDGHATTLTRDPALPSGSPSGPDRSAKGGTTKDVRGICRTCESREPASHEIGFDSCVFCATSAPVATAG